MIDQFQRTIAEQDREIERLMLALATVAKLQDQVRSPRDKDPHT